MESVTGNQVPMEDKLAARFAELEEKIKNMPQEEQDRVRDALCLCLPLLPDTS